MANDIRILFGSSVIYDYFQTASSCSSVNERLGVVLSMITFKHVGLSFAAIFSLGVVLSMITFKPRQKVS